MADSTYPPINPGPPPAPYPYPQAPAPHGHQQGPAPSAEGTKDGNPFGLIAFIAGMLLVAWTFVSAVIQGAIAYGGDFTGFEVFRWVDGAAGILLGLVALTTGIVAVVMRSRPKVLGAIGLGIGILGIANAIAYAVIFPLITSFA